MEVLDGRVAVVTGGASGIGRAVAADLAAHGMHVVVADIEADRAADAAAEAAVAARSGVRVVPLTVDVADAGSVQALADRAFSEFGAVHLLCNNAGVLLFNGFTDSIVEDWQWVWSVNVMGVLHGIHAFLPRMLEHHEPGHIVNTSSVAALNATGAYGTSKAAVLTITDALAEELTGTSVGVSALLPGVVSTRIVAAERNRPETMGRRTDDPDRHLGGGFGFDPGTCAVRLREGVLAGERYIWAAVPDDWDHVGDRARERLDGLLAALPDGIVTDPAPGSGGRPA